MKNTRRFLVAIAIVAMFGFTLASCTGPTHPAGTGNAGGANLAPPQITGGGGGGGGGGQNEPTLSGGLLNAMWAEEFPFPGVTLFNNTASYTRGQIVTIITGFVVEAGFVPPEYMGAFLEGVINPILDELFAAN